MQMTILSYVELYLQYSNFYNRILRQLLYLIPMASFLIFIQMMISNDYAYLKLEIHIFTKMEDMFVGDFSVEEQLVLWPK